MNNYEIIKNMTVDEMAETISAFIAKGFLETLGFDVSMQEVQEKCKYFSNTERIKSFLLIEECENANI